MATFALSERRSSLHVICVILRRKAKFFQRSQRLLGPPSEAAQRPEGAEGKEEREEAARIETRQEPGQPQEQTLYQRHAQVGFERISRGYARIMFYEIQ